MKYNKTSEQIQIQSWPYIQKGHTNILKTILSSTSPLTKSCNISYRNHHIISAHNKPINNTHTHTNAVAQTEQYKSWSHQLFGRTYTELQPVRRMRACVAVKNHKTLKWNKMDFLRDVYCRAIYDWNIFLCECSPYSSANYIQERDPNKYLWFLLEVDIFLP